MFHLSKLFERIVWLNGAVPKALFRSGWAFAPVHMFLEVTYHCNLRCKFCQYLDIIEGKVETVGPVQSFTTEEIKKVIDSFPKQRLITFSGGETLVRKDFPEIIRYASRDHRTHIITNGVLIDEKIAQLYIDLAPRRFWQNGLVLVGVSMEGDEKRHDEVVQRPGSWKKTVEAVRQMVLLRREARKTFPKFNLKLCVTRDTVHEMVDFMYLAKDLGVDLVNFMAEHDLVGHSATLISNPETSNIEIPQARPEGVDPAFLRKQLIKCYELEKKLGLQIRTTPANLPIDEFVRHYTDDRALTTKEYTCEGAWARMGMTAEGRYTICPYFRTGNSREQMVPDIWNGEGFRQFRRDIKRDRIYAGCSGCCNMKYIGPKQYGLAGVKSENPALLSLEVDRPDNRA